MGQEREKQIQCAMNEFKKYHNNKIIASHKSMIT